MPAPRQRLPLLLLCALAAACGTSRPNLATSLVSDDLTCLVEDRKGPGNLVRVQTSPNGPTLEKGPTLLTVRLFEDADGDFQLDEGEEVGEPIRVGNGKTASPRLETVDFDLPSETTLLAITIDNQAGRLDWTVSRNPESGFWQRMHVARSGLTDRR